LDLFSDIDTQKSNYRLTPFKLEINLHKGIALDWPALEARTSSAIKQLTSSSKIKKSPYTSGTDWNAVEKKIEKELEEDKVGFFRSFCQFPLNPKMDRHTSVFLYRYFSPKEKLHSKLSSKIYTRMQMITLNGQ